MTDAEFRVIANRFDSEVGGSAGGAISVVSPPGEGATFVIRLPLAPPDTKEILRQ